MSLYVGHYTHYLSFYHLTITLSYLHIFVQDAMFSSGHGNDEEEGVTPPLTSFNSKGLSRRVSAVVGNYLSDLESSRRIKFDPNSTSEKDLECLIDQVMDSYRDENGNVLPREIIRDALLSNMEKFKQQAENSHLTKEVSYHDSFPSLLY